MYMDNKKGHLPLFGVGPIIVYGQLVFTAISIILTIFFDVKIRIEWLKIPFIIIGIIFIVFGFYLDLSAKLKSKLFKNVEENKLITDGVFGILAMFISFAYQYPCICTVHYRYIAVIFVVMVIGAAKYISSNLKLTKVIGIMTTIFSVSSLLCYLLY